jgi:hypothetical protein
MSPSHSSQFERACAHRATLLEAGSGIKMNLPRREFLRLAAGAAALPAVSRIARAETYPTRPVTMIVPFAAGGPTDVYARIVAGKWAASSGKRS